MAYKAASLSLKWTNAKSFIFLTRSTELGLTFSNSILICSSVVVSIRFLTYNTLTVFMTSSSTSGSGSAQSTAIGCPNKCIRAGISLRLATAAARWFVYCTNANPLFFVLSLALGYTITLTTSSVTFRISSRISSFFLFLGMPPTNSRQLSTLRQRPIMRFLRISKLLSSLTAFLAVSRDVYMTKP